jgi:CSLREA domain-containing protein
LSGDRFDTHIHTDLDLSVFTTITATATTTDGTSEISACITVTDPPPGIAVDSAGDSTTLNGGCDATGDGNTCTLREAITLANTQAGNDAIRFAIPGDGPHVISLVASLPQITQGLSIDGYTQAGALPNADSERSDAVIKIEIRAGSQLTALSPCTSDLIDLRGLALNGGSVATIARGAAVSCPGPLRIRGSWLGFSADGNSISGAVGVVARDPLTFGGPSLADRNVVGNYSIGLLIRDLATGSTVSNNLFGRAPDFSQNAVNTTDIELIDVSGVDIGGESELRNRFFFSNTAVLVRGTNADFNRLYANLFIQNTGSTAIDLSTGNGPDGITPNDVNDIDIGPNDGQNTPVLSDGTAVGSSTTINGVLDVPAGIVSPVQYRLAFYRSSFCNDTSGPVNGRHGDNYLGSVVRSFASNSENFSATITTQPIAGFITATATAPDGSTSEFSNCLVAPRVDAVFANGFE